MSEQNNKGFSTIKIQNIKESFFNLKTILILAVGITIALIFSGVFGDKIPFLSNSEIKELKKEKKELIDDRNKLLQKVEELEIKNEETIKNAKILIKKNDSLRKISETNRIDGKKIDKEYEEINRISDYDDEQLVKFFSDIRITEPETSSSN